MARHLTRASSEKIGVSAGATNFTPGDLTFVAVIQKSTDAISSTVHQHGQGSTKFNINFTTGNALATFIPGTNVVAPTITGVVADGWLLIAISKVSGTTVVRFHKYKYSTNTWTHENSGATNASPGASVDGAYIGGNSNFFDGDIALAGIWNAVLTDVQIEALPFSLRSWWQVAPKAIWTLDQAAVAQTVNDLSGGGSNQNAITGTTIATSSLPVFSYGQPVSYLERQPAAAVGGGGGPARMLLLGAG